MDKEFYLSRLRDKNTTIEEFRKASLELSKLTALESLNDVQSSAVIIDTPHEKTQGVKIKSSPILVIILRSGMAMLPSFLEVYPESKVAVIGIFREADTAKPHLYYQNIPTIAKDSDIFILDPMLATGQSLDLTISLLKKQNVNENFIHVFSFLGADTGIKLISNNHPKVHLHIHQVDKILNKKFEIVPGLGDFGDRFFGN